jgi:hypothetical protein
MSVARMHEMMILRASNHSSRVNPCRMLHSGMVRMRKAEAV